MSETQIAGCSIDHASAAGADSLRWVTTGIPQIRLTFWQIAVTIGTWRATKLRRVGVVRCGASKYDSLTRKEGSGGEGRCIASLVPKSSGPCAATSSISSPSLPWPRSHLANSPVYPAAIVRVRRGSARRSWHGGKIPTLATVQGPREPRCAPSAVVYRAWGATDKAAVTYGAACTDVPPAAVGTATRHQRQSSASPSARQTSVQRGRRPPPHARRRDRSIYGVPPHR